MMIIFTSLILLLLKIYILVSNTTHHQSLHAGNQRLGDQREEGEEAGAASHHCVHVHVCHRDREHVLVGVVVVVIVVVVVVIVIIVVLGVDHVDDQGGGEDGKAHEVEHIELVA